jgi:MoaA/NifB/PqqE/SkfB family radical SAM enzyme
VFYEITRACDLVCFHCRACAQARPHPSELSPRLTRCLVDQLAEFPRKPQLILTGGDPLKRSDIYDVIRLAKTRGLGVSITPSPTPLVTRESVARLAEAGVERLAISVDGPDAASHDRVRGVAGSFDHALRILRWARQYHISTQVNTTITPANADKVADMAELLDGLGIELWSVFFLVPVGRAIDAVRLTPQQYESVFDALWQESQRRSYRIKTTEAPHYRRFLLEQKKNGHRPAPHEFVTYGLNDGKGIMFIGHTGWIHPSGFLPLICGLFPLHHVVDVYQRSGVFRALRDAARLEGKCGACEFRKICGGSRARAFAVTGNPLAAEPDCVYVPRGWAESAFGNFAGERVCS